ncbi:hypothetical protein PFAG_05005 [Plasmodium falciparum Santa Lucia]|uniref:Uncharacterized protein n=1 Tax=Plasmodium falciparum Santa Lucia TaxID=478859 RepID=W7FCY3_PLAFA|nr:hypothetical protein PFAG_05005 [Plasmodium falciparum Santa Lucia]
MIRLNKTYSYWHYKAWQRATAGYLRTCKTSMNIYIL